MILGIHVATQYNIGSAKLESGDSLVLFTDGITEAENGQGQLYTIDRAIKQLSASNRESSKAMIDHLLQDIDHHASAISQSDDITVLALQYH